MWSAIFDVQEGFQKTYVEHAMASRLADDAEVSVRSQPRAAWSIAEVRGKLRGHHGSRSPRSIKQVFKRFYYNLTSDYMDVIIYYITAY